MPSTPRRFDILTIFPEIFAPVLSSSIIGRAAASGIIEWHTTDIRDFTDNKHEKVDDRPFGGGPGMVMMCQPIWDAVIATEAQDDRPSTRILMTPQGTPLTQSLVRELSKKPRLLIIAGHYEGIDERVVSKLDPLEISIGDYVLSGGEVPALVLIDGVVRLLPGALGHAESASQDSFERTSVDGGALLDCPHYTRPRVWEGMEVPEILISGDHAKVRQWRLEQALERTKQRRPDLLENPPTPMHNS